MLDTKRQWILFLCLAPAWALACAIIDNIWFDGHLGIAWYGGGGAVWGIVLVWLLPKFR